MRWFDMAETPYRASQLCRVLGNPKAYQILQVLRTEEIATPSQLASRLHRSVSTVSSHLRSLREVHLVRYTRAGREAVYRLKCRNVARTMARLERLVLEARRMP
jgi:DNA-binding transcriptional ArsR family regulator